jgi:hypothetical protein
VIGCFDWSEHVPTNKMRKMRRLLKRKIQYLPLIFLLRYLCMYFIDIKQPIKINQIKTTLIIVIGTLRDPTTPYSWAVALNKLVTNSLLIKLDDDGHTGHGRGSACVDKTVDAYFIIGKIPATARNATSAPLFNTGFNLW